MVPLSRLLTGQRHAPVVYFARMGGYVKIGTTVNLRSRMSSLYVPLENVLAVVPGGKDEEDAYHKRFEASQVRDDPRRELFRLDPQLRKFLHLGPKPRPQEDRLLPVAAESFPVADEMLPVVPGVPPGVVRVLLRLLAAPGGTTGSQAGAALRKSKTLAWEYLSALRDHNLATLTGDGRSSRWTAMPFGDAESDEG